MREQVVYISKARSGRIQGKDPDLRIILTEVLGSLAQLKADVQKAKVKGYDPGTDFGSQWLYRTKEDEAVCNVCRPMHGRIFSGPSIQATFPFAISIDDELMEPNTHAPRDLKCRCKLILLNADDRIEAMLDKEVIPRAI
jgi:hypothetical protein